MPEGSLQTLLALSIAVIATTAWFIWGSGRFAIIAFISCAAWGALAVFAHSAPKDVVPRVEQFCVLGLSALLLLIAGARLRTMGRYGSSSWLTLLVPLAIGAFALRAFYPPDFVHSEHYGFGILSGIARFPDISRFQDAYGQTTYVIQGLLFHASGGWWRMPFLVNAAAATGSLVLLSLLARRWTSSDAAAISVMLMGAIHPGLVRLAASEDANNIGMLFLSGSLLATDIWAQKPHRRRPLIAAGAMAVLAAWSRQTMVACLPVPFVVAALRGGRAAIKRPEAWATSVAVLGLTLMHLFSTSGDQGYVYFALLVAIPIMFVQAFVEPHPLLDPLITPPMVLPLVFLGITIEKRLGNPVWKALCFWFVLGFVVSLVFFMVPLGSRIIFRTPILMSAILASGIGLFRLLESLSSLGQRSFRLLMAFGTITVVALSSLPGLALLSKPGPLMQEYEFLLEALPRLPKGATLVTFEKEDLHRGLSLIESNMTLSRWTFPRFLAEKANVKVSTLGESSSSLSTPSECRLFYRGLLCYSAGFPEVSSPKIRGRIEALFEAHYHPWKKLVEMVLEGLRIGRLLSDPSYFPPFGLEKVQKLRRACFVGSEATGPPYKGLEKVIHPRRDKYPDFVRYPSEPITLGFYVVPGSTCP